MSEHPVPGVGVGVVDDGRVLLIQRGRGALTGKWAVPGGKVHLGETLEEAAIREVKEETGLDVRLGGVVWVGETLGPGDPPAWHYVLIDFLGEIIGGELKVGDDAADAVWCEIDRAYEFDLAPKMPPMLQALKRRLEVQDDR